MTNAVSSVVIALCAAAAPAWAQGFTPGMIYTTCDGGFVELNTQLQFQRFVPIPTLGTCTGAVFNSAGNLVFMGRIGGETRIIEVSGTGAILRSAPSGMNGLLLGSYIDFNPVTNQYVYANDNHITLLDANLSPITSSANTFDRASGVAFGSDGIIYATDQMTGEMHRFGPSLNVLPSVNIGGFHRTGIDVADNGDIFLTDFGNRNVQRWNHVTGVVTTLATNFPFVSDVEQLPDGSVVAMDGSQMVRRFSATGELMFSGQYLGPNGQGLNGDGLAYFVPAPGGAGALLLPLGCLVFRRRR